MEIRFIHPIVENDHFIFEFIFLLLLLLLLLFVLRSFKFLVNMYEHCWSN